jgi:SOS-response transcriptional repressor LexA/DNA-binding XRE family transcriptional regulator
MKIMAENIFSTRLRRIRESFGLNQTAFAQGINIPRTSLINYEKGTAIPPDVLNSLVGKYDVNADWFLTGNGKMFLDKEAVEPVPKHPLIMNMENLIKQNIESLESRISSLESSFKRLESPAPEQEYPADEPGGGYTADPEPEYGEDAGPVAFREQVAAGPPIDQSEDEGLVVDVPLRHIRTKPGDYYVLRVRGNSMIDALIPDGSMVLIRKSDAPVNGAIQVVSIDGQATLKRLREGEDHSWTVCYEDGSGRTIAMGEGLRAQGDFVAVLPPSTRPRMRGGHAAQ